MTPQRNKYLQKNFFIKYLEFLIKLIYLIYIDICDNSNPTANLYTT